MRVACLCFGLILVAACTPPRADNGPRLEATPAARQAPDPPRARWQPQGVVTDARTVEPQTYRVRPGDSLSVIAERTGSAVRAIAGANGLAPPFTIFPDQRLRIPGGRYHSVNRGETGIAIALAYKVDWDRIVEANDLKPPFLLRVGQKLLLPASAPPQVMADADAGTDAGTGAGAEAGSETQTAAFDLDIDDIISGGEAAVEAGEPAQIAAAPREVRPFDGRFQWPVDGRLISGFGAKAGGLYNDGLNIAADMGTPVRAAASGTVIYAGNGVEGWGNIVLLKHSDRWVSAYAHTDAFYVERGDRVNGGEVIAEVGATGSVTRPQLHFELRDGRKAVDPRQFLPAG